MAPAIWHPILEDEDLATAAKIVHDVLSDLLRGIEQGIYDSQPDVLAEAALLISAVETDDAKRQKDLSLLLERCLTSLRLHRIHPWFFGGLLEVGWIQNYLCGRPESWRGFHESIDNEFTRLFGLPTWEPKLDLVGGLLGLGAYWLQRLPDRPAELGLGLLVDHLDKRAVKHDGGITWPIVGDVPWIRGAAGPVYPLGMAHGVAGTVAFLAQLSKAVNGNAQLSRLLNGAVDWLLAQLRANGGRRFPALLGLDIDTSRFFGWCWGDLGIASALLEASSVLDRPDLRATAMKVVQDTFGALPTPEDMSLCHGPIGFGHLYNCFFQETGDEGCRDAARRWLRRGCAAAVAGEGVGGFARIVAVNQTKAQLADPGFLMGASGIALALLAAIKSDAPRWNHLILLPT